MLFEIILMALLNVRNTMDLNQNQKDLLERYLQSVVRANETTNLTRITSIPEARILHLEDSLAGLPEFAEAPEGRYADLGSGAGFPGVPIAIATGRKTLLVDSVKKKMALLDGIIEELGLSDQVQTYAGRIEELALEERSGFAVLTARALAAMPSLIELASPLLRQGGHLISYKSTHSDDEIDQADKLENRLGLKRISRRDFMLSDNETKRSIVVYEKIHEASVTLPRRPGMAQKRPYKD